LAASDLGGRVRVIDTGTAAGAQGLVVLHAPEVARAGGTLDEVEAAAHHVESRVRLLGALNTLEYLIGGGRVDGALGGLANRMGVCPLFELSGGRLRRLRPAWSRQGANNRLLAAWRRSRPADARLHVIALHVMARQDAEQLLEQVQAEAEPATGLIAEFGAVMVAHTGPGLIALSWWWQHHH
jgi:DegV family protein with EDD domain